MNKEELLENDFEQVLHVDDASQGLLEEDEEEREDIRFIDYDDVVHGVQTRSVSNVELNIF